MLPNLQPQHQKLIKESGISEAVCEARGYYSETMSIRLKPLSFTRIQRVVPALVIPIWGVTGKKVSHQIRPDQPRIQRKDRRVVKYETPAGTTLSIDVHPNARTKVLTATEPLFITEGVRKGDSAVSRGLACVALLGVDGWTKDKIFWQSVPLQERPVYIVFDSDIIIKPEVFGAARRLHRFLEEKGARPHVLALPANGECKVGLDDYFVAGGTVEGLYSLPKIEPSVVASTENDASIPCYVFEVPTLLQVVETKDGPRKIPLANFLVIIRSEIVFHSSTDSDREFEADATVDGVKMTIRIPAVEFEEMRWHITKLGPRAIIYPGKRDQVRAAIQVLSNNSRTLVGIRSTGWHLVRDQWFYVHGGGIIHRSDASRDDSAEQNRPDLNTNQANDLTRTGCEGTISPALEDALGIRVVIHDEKHRHRLPSASSGAQLVEDFAESIKLLSLAPDKISHPLYAAIWCSIMAPPDFSMHLYGQTGVFKSEYAALIAQHFSPDNDARSFLGWSSTSNFIRAAVALQGHSIIVIDDFVPTGSQYDIEKSNRAMEDVFRGQGNGAGRGRCNRDGTIQSPSSPRCLVLSTGEVRPSGQSLTARVVTVEVNDGDIARQGDAASLFRLSCCQSAARQGCFARLTAAFIEWLAMDYKRHLTDFKETCNQIRVDLSGKAKHARTTDSASKLMAGFHAFLEFAHEKCELSPETFATLWKGCSLAFEELLKLQDQEQSDESPATKFITLIRTALSTGQAHLRFLEPLSDFNLEYGSPVHFGYKEVWTGRKRSNAEAGEDSISIMISLEEDLPPDRYPLDKPYYVPQGQRIGWKDNSDIYLEPHEALAMVQRLAKEMGQPPIPMNAKALGKRLVSHGLLVSQKNGRNLARKSIDGSKLEVFHLNVRHLLDLTRWELDLPNEEDERMYNEHENAVRRDAMHSESMEIRRQKVQAFKDEQFKKMLN